MNEDDEDVDPWGGTSETAAPTVAKRLGIGLLIVAAVILLAHWQAP